MDTNDVGQGCWPASSEQAAAVTLIAGSIEGQTCGIRDPEGRSEQVEGRTIGLSRIGEDAYGTHPPQASQASGWTETFTNRSLFYTVAFCFVSSRLQRSQWYWSIHWTVSLRPIVHNTVEQSSKFVWSGTVQTITLDYYTSLTLCSMPKNPTSIRKRVGEFEFEHVIAQRI